MDDVTATHDGKTGRVHYFQIHFEMCLQQLIIKVSASYNSLIDTEDPAKECSIEQVLIEP